MLLEDVLISLRGVLLALMRVNAFVVVVEGIVQDLERTESRENERNDMMAIDNGLLIRQRVMRCNSSEGDDPIAEISGQESKEHH